MRKFFVALLIGAMAVLAGACQKTEESANANLNANTGDNAATITSTAPDNSELITTTRNGVKTETRTFRDNPRVSRVVVTTRDGNRTVKVYSPSGEERELKSSSSDPLTATGDAIADGAGFVARKSETVADKTKEGTKTVVEKTGETAKTVGEKTAAKTKSTGTTVVDKTKEGVKKTGNAIKKVVTP